MRLYLDDNLADPVLAPLLRNARHDVPLPSDVGKVGAGDAIHLTQGVHDQRVCLTCDYGDWEDLHNPVLAVQGIIRVS